MSGLSVIMSNGDLPAIISNINTPRAHQSTLNPGNVCRADFQQELLQFRRYLRETKTCGLVPQVLKFSTFTEATDIVTYTISGGDFRDFFDLGFPG